MSILGIKILTFQGDSEIDQLGGRIKEVRWERQVVRRKKDIR